ncbi:DUF1127 domain-containing protein [Kaarinaea lacus]
MMRIIEAIKTAYERSVIRVGRARARRELLSMSDRSLADIGFSRELLEIGVSAWPWRLNQDIGPINFVAPAATCQPPMRLHDKREYRQAVAELQAFSDLELADVGLERGQIEDAVKYGRPGIDDVTGGYKHAA